MRLPFTPDEFFAICREYNQTFWPAPVVLALLAFASIGLVARPSRWSDRFIAVVLSLLWMWMAVGYHFWFFSRINPLAYAFAAMFAMGSALFCWNGVVRTKMHFSFKWRGVRTAAGISLVLYALLIYPLLLIAGGHRYPAAPTFGLPCPTTIFTLGMLAFANPLKQITIIPVVWCAVGVQAAFFLEVLPDLALAPAGLVGLWSCSATRRMLRP